MKFQKTFLVLILFINFFNIYAQRTIKGKVIYDSFHVFSGVKIFKNDTILIGKTDINGNFEIKSPIETPKLTFSSLGYEVLTIIKPVTCNYLEIILLADAEYHTSGKKMDQIRKKRFDKLTEFHEKAFKKEVFKSERPCFKYKFEPYKPERDKIERKLKLIKKQIKIKFKELEIGDTVKVPTQTWSAYTDNKDYGCLITGTIIEKNKKKGSYNLIIKVTDNLCEKDKATYNGNPVKIGDSISHNMKYYKIVTE